MGACSGPCWLPPTDRRLSADFFPVIIEGDAGQRVVQSPIEFIGNQKFFPGKLSGQLIDRADRIVIDPEIGVDRVGIRRIQQLVPVLNDVFEVIRCATDIGAVVDDVVLNGAVRNGKLNLFLFRVQIVDLLVVKDMRWSSPSASLP